MSIEIGLLPAGVPAKSRGNPLRQEDLAASRTAPLTPPLAHAPSNSAHLRFWLSWWATMARPYIGDRPMTSAERMRRYRARKRGSDVRPITCRPLPAVTKPGEAVTKPRFDPKAMIG
jgi:hypothetical protein